VNLLIVPFNAAVAVLYAWLLLSGRRLWKDFLLAARALVVAEPAERQHFVALALE
jgi:hypothetical protein